MAWFADFLAAKERRLFEQKHAVLEEALAEFAASRSPARDFVAALQRGPAPSVIAEVKFASPSMGVLRPARNVEFVAAGYAAAGACALSVLTEPRQFAGDLAFLERASLASGLPVLRKDFLLDPYEVTEARAHGADAVLLIARLLTRGSLAAMLERTEDLGMAALVEIHSVEEIALLAGLPVQVVGVNHRDLDTLAIDPSLSARLANRLPEGAVWVAESGLECGADLLRMAALGYGAALVGSAFMSRPDPGAALASLLEECRAAR